MRNLSILVLSGLFLSMVVSLRSEVTRVTVTSTEGFDTAAAFESREGCLTTRVQVALTDHEERTQPPGATTLRQSGLISLTQFSDPENGQDCPAVLLQESSASLGPASDEVSLEIDRALDQARFSGQALLKDQQGNDHFLLFDVMWKAIGPLKSGHRTDDHQEDKTKVRTVYKAKTRKAVAYGFMGQCDTDQDGACSAEEEKAAVNYLSIPSQGEETFIRWRKIRTVLEVEE